MLIHKLKYEADFQLEAILIREQMKLFLDQGKFIEAFQCAQALQDQQTALEIINCKGQLPEVKVLIELGKLQFYHLDQACQYIESQLQTKVNISDNVRYGFAQECNQAWNFKLREDDDLPKQMSNTDHIKDKELENVHRLNIGYDEAPFQNVVKLGNNPFKTKFMHSVVCDNLSNWLGYDSLISEGNVGVVIQQRDLFEEVLPGQKVENIEEDKEPLQSKHGEELEEEVSPDEFDERKYCIFYWRFDEGKGNTVNDMTDNENTVKVPNESYDWSEEQLQDSKPLDYEDKWGKQNQPSYALVVDGFSISSDSANGLLLGIPSAVSQKHKLINNFTLEFWLNIDYSSTPDWSILVLQTSTTKLTLTPNALLIQTATSKNLRHPLPQTLPLKTWTHFAFSNNASKDTFTIFLNSEPVLTLSPLALIPNFNDTLTLFQPQQQLRYLITEVRLWSVNLTKNIVKDIYKQPLAMLYEQKRAIKIKIKKQSKDNEANQGKKLLNAPKQLAAPGKQLAPQKKELKMGSMFDKKIKNKKDEQQSSEKRSEEQKIQSEKKDKSETQIVDEEEKAITSSEKQNSSLKMPESSKKLNTLEVQQNQDAFDFGFNTAAKPNPIHKLQPVQSSNDFDFFGGFQAQQPPSVQPSTNFDTGFDFMQSSSLHQQNSQSQRENLVEEASGFSIDSSFNNFHSPPNKPPTQEIAFSPNKSINLSSPSPQNLVAMNLNTDQPHHQQVKIKSGKLSGTILVDQSSQAIKVIPRNLLMPNSIKKLSESRKTEPDVQQSQTTSVNHENIEEESKVAKMNLSHSKSDWGEQTAEDSIEKQRQVLGLLLESKLMEADKLIEDGLAQSRINNSQRGSTPSKRSNSEADQLEKEKLKRDVRAFSTLKLACNLSLVVAQYKQQIITLQSQLQDPSQASKHPQLKKHIDDLQSTIASMSNALILLQLPPSPEDSISLKKAFLKFALTQNYRIRNFQAASKIVQFYRKQIPPSQHTEQEKQKIDQVEATCIKTLKHSTVLPVYVGAECPSCNEPLAFGLGSPQCHKCLAKIGVCYGTLRPVNNEKASKCKLCLAQFDPKYAETIIKTSPNKRLQLCPICQLHKLE